ncbi:MAG: hypothetical protein ACRDG5_10710 [Anaerolineales bacterium]
MNEEEAWAILAQELREWRGRPYAALAAAVGDSWHAEVIAPSGARSQLEVNAVWDDRAGRNVRVIGSIDDGGLRAFVPLSDDFIVAPDGHFVGEQRRGNEGERLSP